MRTFLVLIVTLAVAMAVAPAGAAPTLDGLNQKRLAAILDRVPGTSAAERTAVLDALRARFKGKLIEKGYLPTIEALINQGLFEQARPRAIAEISFTCIAAIKRGATPELAVQVAEIGFARPIAEDQLLGAATELRNFSTTGIPEETYRNLVVHWLGANWGRHVMHAAMRTIQDGHRKGVNAEMLGLILFDRLMQAMRYPDAGQLNDLDERKARRICKKELKVMAHAGRRTKELARRTALFKAMKRAEASGVPAQIGQDVFLVAMRKNWPASTSQQAFLGLTRANGNGMILEPLADALTDALERGMTVDEIMAIIEQEQKNEEENQAERLKAIAEVPQPPPPQPPPPPAEPDRSTESPRLNKPLMQNSIDSFIGTPYMWGGTTRKGTDCSGFTSSVYREQGMVIPRNSRKQQKFGEPVPRAKARYGDLVFFTKRGGKRINHVGLYLGKGKMVHAGCSKGVTIVELDKRYYKARYHSMGDMIDKIKRGR